MNKHHPPLTLTCEYCGVAFQRRYSYHRYLVETRGTIGIFCSRPCKNASEISPVAADVVALYADGATLIEIAAQTGLSGSGVRNRLLRAGVELRSRTAHLMTDRNPTRGKGHTDATKEKLRTATVRQFSNPEARTLAAHNQSLAMAEGRISAISRIEDIVASELDRLGIEYIRQKPIRHPGTGRYCACVDFLFADGRALEVNGTYWHTDPRAYPNGPIHASQRHTARKYAAKTAALAELGIPLMEVWEMDVRANPSDAVRAALALP